MHTHPSSMPPSIADFNSAYSNRYKLGIIICHNGEIYCYSSDQYIEYMLYIQYINRFILQGYSEKEAQMRSLERLKENHDIDFWEVK